jgi:hypothetical protein
MTTIRHVCAGHEYRYNTVTGDVHNNYGTHVAALRICKFSGYANLYRVTDMYVGYQIASTAPGLNDIDLAKFAIGHTAANI